MRKRFYVFSISLAVLILGLVVLLLSRMKIHLSSLLNINKDRYACSSSYSVQLTHVSTHGDKQQIPGHSYKEQARLRNMSITIASLSTTAKDNIPTVPCLSADGRLLVLSASASRIRFGVSVSFTMVHPSDMKFVLPKNMSAKPLFLNQLNLWCLFDDGSMTPAYSYDNNVHGETASFLDCPLSSFAGDQLWRYNRTLRVYLSSLAHKDQTFPILKAFVTVPRPVITPIFSQQLLTMCTSPLHNKAKYLTQWIEFHRLVGFHKFVIYNTTDNFQHLSAVVDAINKRNPNTVDVIQWNFASLSLTDRNRGRYFQMQALHDCFIRYGDQSEWMGMLDLDEYIVPLPPYESMLDYLHKKFDRQIIGSVNLRSQFFCNKHANKYTLEEKDTNRLVIERFTLRAKNRLKSGRQKYLYRPRFVQYITIHTQLVGSVMKEPLEKDIMLAHYVTMERLRKMPGCSIDCVNDTSIRDRFAKKIKEAIAGLM